MNTRTTVLGAAIVAALLAPLANASGPAAKAPVAKAPVVAQAADKEAILRKLEAAGKSLKTLQADIAQEERDTELGSTDRSAGTIYYKAGTPGNERFMIEYTRPAPQTVSIIGDKITLYQPTIKQATVTTRKEQAGKGKGYSALGMGYGQVGQEYREKYNITVIGEETVGSAKTVLLNLKPKAAGEPIIGMQVWVDTTTNLPVQYVTASKGKRTKVTLSNVKKDVKLDDSKFEIKLPSDVTVGNA